MIYTPNINDVLYTKNLEQERKNEQYYKTEYLT